MASPRPFQLDELVALLAALPANFQTFDFDGVKARVLAARAAAVAAGDEPAATTTWTLLRTLKAHRGYVNAFTRLRGGDFFGAWCALDDCEGHLSALSGRLTEPSLIDDLSMVAEHVTRWQSLYPYTHFSSPELVVEGLACNICGATVTPRTDCGHRVGEIYGGRIAGRKATGVGRIAAVAIVTAPMHRYAVLFPIDPKTGKKVDPYDYSTLRWIAERLASPYHRWTCKVETRSYRSDELQSVGRNDPCPCRSGRKYKRCCLGKAEGVLGQHTAVAFEHPPADAQQGVTYFGTAKQRWPGGRRMEVMLMTANDQDDD